MAIDAATRDSLELTRSVGGGVAGSLLGEIDRCQTAAGRRLLAEDICRAADRPAAIEARLALVAWLHEDALRRERVRAALKAMPDFARALARLAAGRGSPRDLALLRDGLGAAAALKAELEREPDRPAAARQTCCRGSAAMPRLVDQLTRGAGRSRRRSTASKGGYIAEGYDAGARRVARCGVERPPGDRRAREPLSRRDRHRVAEDPPQCRARLSCRGLRPARRPADGAGQRASPTARRWPAWSASIRPSSTTKRARVVEAGGHALAAEAAHAEELTALAVAAAPHITATAEAIARIDVAASHAAARRRRRLVPARS